MLLASPKEFHEGATKHFQGFLSKQSEWDVPDLSQLISVEVMEEENEGIA